MILTSCKMKAVIVLSLCVLIRGIIIQTEYEHKEILSSPLITLSFNKLLNMNEGTFCLKGPGVYPTLKSNVGAKLPPY